MENLNRISCEYKGEVITGEFVNLKSNEMTIKLIDPESDLVMSSPHIMVLCLRNSRYTEYGKLTKLGHKTAISFLNKLYDLHHFRENNHKQLNEIIESLKSIIHPIFLESQEKLIANEESRKIFRKQFKNEEISQKEYMNNLKNIRDDNYEIEQRLKSSIQFEIYKITKKFNFDSNIIKEIYNYLETKIFDHYVKLKSK